MQDRPKIEKMGKLKFLERGVPRLRKLQKLHQDPTLTPSKSMVGL